MTALMMLINRSMEMLKQEDGQGLVEYSMLFMFIVIVLIVALTTLGMTVQTVLYDQLANQLF
jgi:Flp pilus assembly pilin Flp